MNDWSEGYVKGIDYNYDCYPELNPARAALAFLNAGLVPPQSPVAACELGFGFGISPALHACASATVWWGTDFNPAQAFFARELAAKTGANAFLFDQSFAEFCGRSDLPDFDFVGLHGVWTWVSEENRRVIIDFLRRKVKPGGVVYASYNTLPGWAQVAPLRKLMIGHAETLSPAGAPISARIDAAVAFANAVVAASPGMAQLYPLLAGRLQAMGGYAKSYVAHEYFNRDWDVMAFSEIAAAMEGAKLSFACSADLAHHFDRHNLNQAQTGILASIPDATMRETTRDFMINRQFRKDYWVRGARRLDPAARDAALAAHRVVLTTDPAKATGEVDGALSGRALDPAALGLFLELMSDMRPRSLGEVAAKLSGRGVSLQVAVEVAMILINRQGAASLQDEAAAASATASSTAYNSEMLARAERGAGLSTLAAPLTGGSMIVAPFHQTFLAARARVGGGPSDWAAEVWRGYKARGTRVMRGGVVIEGEEESLAALAAEAEAFASSRLPALVAVGAA